MATLRALRPGVAARRLVDSPACPIELGELLVALGGMAPLVAFTPPIGALGSASAGILRAARQRRAAVALRIDISGLPGRALADAFEAIAGACSDAEHAQPFALVASGTSVADGDVDAAVACASECIEAGFPAIEVGIGGKGQARALAADLERIVAPAREAQLGWVLAAADPASPSLTELLAMLAARDCAPTAVRASALLDLPPAGPARWLVSRGPTILSISAAIIEAIDLQELPPAATRAEALAYFAADAALGAWHAGGTGPRAASALLARWNG